MTSAHVTKKASLLKSSGLFVLSITLVLAFRWILFEPFVIPSGSMIPTLLINDHIVVSKYSYGLRVPFTSKWIGSPQLPKRGDIVVFKSTENDGIYLIKRVVGLPGDQIEFTAEGVLRVNGTAVPSTPVELGEQWSVADLGGRREGWVAQQESLPDHQYTTLLDPTTYRYEQAPIVVSPNKLFLMGDNRDHSRDSRFWGELPIENLLGKAQLVWLSCEHTLSKVQFLCDPRSIRWQRFLHRIQ